MKDVEENKIPRNAGIPPKYGFRMAFKYHYARQAKPDAGTLSQIECCKPNVVAK